MSRTVTSAEALRVGSRVARDRGVTVRLVRRRGEDALVGARVDRDRLDLGRPCRAQELGLGAGGGVEHVEIVVAAEARGRAGAEAHEHLAVRQGRRARVGAAVRREDRERMLEEVALRRGGRVRVDDARVDEVVAGGRAPEVDADRPVEDPERARAVHGRGTAEDRREVLVGELDDVGRLLVPDRPALGIQRVVVAAVEVLAAQRELVETRRSLLGGVDRGARPA